MRLIYYLTVVTVFVVSCSGESNHQVIKPVVTVSLLPQKYWVDRLAGNLIETNAMLVDGADHSTYEPTAEQMRKISQSAIYFRIGNIDFENAWVPRFKSSNPNLNIIDLSENLDLSGVETFQCRHHTDTVCADSHHSEHRCDPHTWMSPLLVRRMVSTISNELCKILPEETATIRKNEATLHADIDSLDNYINNKFVASKNRKFLLFHPALTWYAQRYGLEQLVVEVDGKEPSASKLREIIEEVRSENIKVVLIQNEFPFERATVIAQETNAEIAQIKPLDYNWLTIMYEITDIIDKALTKSN